MRVSGRPACRSEAREDGPMHQPPGLQHCVTQPEMRRAPSLKRGACRAMVVRHGSANAGVGADQSPYRWRSRPWRGRRRRWLDQRLL